MWLKLDYPYLGTVKVVAREEAWDHGVVQISNYASAVE